MVVAKAIPAIGRVAVLTALLSSCQQQYTTALDNGAGALPALGWSSWNLFGNSINKAAILEIADALVATNLSKVGFKYVNVDAGAIIRSRDPVTGKPVVNKAKFPRGMRALADSIHAKGFCWACTPTSQITSVARARAAKATTKSTPRRML
jgi:alpha-galactosidase